MRGMKTTKGDRHDDAKAERRAKRKPRTVVGTTAGCGCRSSAARWIGKSSTASWPAAQSLDLDAPWPDIAPLVLPVLRRVHHPYPPEAAPDAHLRAARRVDRVRHRLRTGVHPRHVRAQVERWGVDHATLLGTALENLRALTLVERPRVERIHPDGVETIAIQGQGWGSALILVPEVLRPILGDGAAGAPGAGPQHARWHCPRTSTRTSRSACGRPSPRAAHDELDMNLLRWTGTTVVVGRRRGARAAELGRLRPGRRAARWRDRAASVARSVVGPARRDERPERGAVPEHPQVGELVDHDRLEGLAAARGPAATRTRVGRRARHSPSGCAGRAA